jgi:xylitol oxidase
MNRKNWAGNYWFGAARLLEPRTLEELQEAVKRAEKVKVVGAGHSFNGIADSTGDQISLRHFAGMDLNDGARTVRVGAGVSYGQLSRHLDARGYALRNLASLPHISVVGACSTGTHGSGSGNGNLATAVRRIELVKADGESVQLSGEECAGAAVGLGALGAITSVTLEVIPRFEIRQAVYENLSFRHFENHLEEIFAGAYSVSVFTEWCDGLATQVWVKRKDDEAPFEREFFGAQMAARKLHPLSGHAAESCTEQGGAAGPWYERLPHFRMDHRPSSGDELQTEYFVPRERGYEAIRAVEELRDRIAPLLYVSEFRTIAEDKLWMSPCYRRASLAIHFTWKPDWAAVRDLLPAIEERLAPFDARPHWGKLFAMNPASGYARLGDFRERMRSYDPAAKFENEYLRKCLY